MNRKGYNMQQRFCACGCAIWVQYLFPNHCCPK